jgi:ABC-type nitrate/sulfonate/bicarbonate transport system permease component
MLRFIRLPELAMRSAPAVLSVSTLLAIWEAYVDLAGVPPTTLPAPSRVITQAFVEHAALLSNSWPTLQATISGFGLSLAIAFVFSVAIDFAPRLRAALMPVFVISQTLPLVAIAPLIVLWFGFGLLPKILLVALVTFFPMLVALARGYAAAEPEIEELLASMGASRWKRFIVARLPASLPYFFAGLRISITYAVVGAIFAEYAGAARGLGIYILNAKNNFRADLVLAAVLVSSLLTLILFSLAVLVERLAMPWHRVSRDERR